MNQAQDPSQPLWPAHAERDIFLAALDYPSGPARASYLEKACGGNPALRRAVDDLLEHDLQDTFLLTPAVTPLGELSELSELPEGKIGPYKLLQKIGEGGCGVVYMAEQEQPIRRRLALKVIKLGMDTKSVIARFEAERQALAMMDHPFIARVLDAGATPTGRPYFVMDLVRGIKITEYCDQNNLSTQDRLELFIGVCQAIQHAHQKGIIHRDIKPSNVLVTLHDSVPVPKVIDFGVAKAIGQRLTDKTVFTEFQAFVGTPAYTSPEQAEMSGLDIDTRSDIYSLGVLLYELLTGLTPFDAGKLAASGLDQMRRTIREEEPVAPSTRVATMLDEQRTATARHRQTDPDRLAGAFRGDLDWIVMKALEKDRTRRYGTASEFAQDIQRHLNNEPIAARPPSGVYRFQKFVRRNKLPFAAAAAFILALSLGLVLAAWQYFEKNGAYKKMLAAEHEQRQLREQAEQSRAQEIQLRRAAEGQETAARRKAYAADMNLVAQSLAANNLGRAQQLLDQQRPAPGAADLRGWEWRYLWQHCQSDALFTLCQLTNEINSLSLSHDGRWVAIGDAEGGLAVWDLRARQEHARLPKSTGAVIAAFSPTAPLLAFAGGGWFGPRGASQQTVRLWDGDERRIARELALEGRCEGLIFSRDGQRLLTAAAEKLTIWNVADGTKAAEHSAPGLQGFRSGAALAATDDLSVVAHPVADRKIRVADLKRGVELWSAEAAEEQITALKFSPDGKLLVSGAGFVESAVRLWDAESGSPLGRLDGHRTWVTSLQFWQDGQTLASASGDQTIRLWELPDFLRAGSSRPSRRFGPRRERGLPFRELATLRGHKLEVWGLALLPDQTTLVSASKDGSVFVWDTTLSKRERSRIVLPVRARAWRFSAESDVVTILDVSGTIARWSGADFQQSTPLMEIAEARFGAMLSDDARWLAAASTNGIHIWDLEKKVLAHQLPASPGPPGGAAFLKHQSELFVWSSVEGGAGAILHALDLKTRAAAVPWSTMPKFSGPPMAFSTDGNRLLCHGFDGPGSLWDFSSGSGTKVNFVSRQMFGAAFSPDSKLFAAVSRSGACELWETGGAAPLAVLRGFLQAMNSIAFSPDGQRLAIGGNGTEAVKIWDVQSYQEILTLEGQGSIFHSIGFSPDGNILAASNREGALHLWKAPPLSEIERQEAQNR